MRAYRGGAAPGAELRSLVVRPWCEAARCRAAALCLTLTLTLVLVRAHPNPNQVRPEERQPREPSWSLVRPGARRARCAQRRRGSPRIRAGAELRRFDAFRPARPRNLRRRLLTIRILMAPSDIDGAQSVTALIVGSISLSEDPSEDRTVDRAAPSNRDYGYPIVVMGCLSRKVRVSHSQDSSRPSGTL